jgi:hypothetical protein
MFNNLPECLFDKILQYSDVKDIVSFSNTNEEHKEIVRKITINKNSLVQKTFEMEDDICDIENWLFMSYSKYNLKNSKQYYDIFKNINSSYGLTFYEFRIIFSGLTENINEDFSIIKNKDKQKQYNYLLFSIYELFNNHIHTFYEEFNDNNNKLKGYMLDFLIKIYNKKISFINNEGILILLKKIFTKLIDDISNFNKDDIEDLFIYEFLQNLFLNDEYDNITKFLDFLFNYIEEKNLGYYFLVPEDNFNESFHENTQYEFIGLY